MKNSLPYVLMIIILLLPVSASAYIGPGLGFGAIGVVLGVIGAILVGVFAILYYPLKRLIRKRRKAAEVREAREKDDNNPSSRESGDEIE